MRKTTQVLNSFHSHQTTTYWLKMKMPAVSSRKAKPTIYTLVSKGQLPAYKKGKKLYFYEDKFLA